MAKQNVLRRFFDQKSGTLHIVRQISQLDFFLRNIGEKIFEIWKLMGGVNLLFFFHHFGLLLFLIVNAGPGALPFAIECDLTCLALPY